jgi:hypothetical protein
VIVCCSAERVDAVCSFWLKPSTFVAGRCPSTEHCTADQDPCVQHCLIVAARRRLDVPAARSVAIRSRTVSGRRGG